MTNDAGKGAEVDGPVSVDPLLAAKAGLERIRADAAALAAEGSGTAGTELSVARDDLSAGSVKTQLALARARALKMKTELKAAGDEMRRRLDEQMRLANEAMGPLEEMVKRLEEGIWTVNLYLGRDEEIVTLRDGQPAPAESLITIRQAVLSMDQECAIAAESGGIDAQSIDSFDAWLLADPAHLDQVLPEQKGVVVLVPRRTKADYGDPWVQGAMDKRNHQSYWLIRNGERLFRMATEFDAGNVLVPKREEFVSFFQERRHDFTTGQDEYVPIVPGSPAWLAAERAADARRRHYMRVALVLQGLLDRTTVFHPLPPEPVSLLSSQSYERGAIVVVTDADRVLYDGTERFRDWLDRLNKELRPGMRIVGAFNSTAFRGANHLERQSGHSRLSPRGARYPKSGELYRIERREAGGGLTFLYERDEEIWAAEPTRNFMGRRGRDFDLRKPKVRAACVIHSEDRFIIPFDLVTVEQMRHYLGLRTERLEYLDMMPLLRAAIRAKEAEAESEAPFRMLLAGEIVKRNGVEHVDAEAAVPALVDWWKLANRWHRPLIKDAAREARALEAIVREDGRRRAQAALGDEDAVAAARLLEAAPDAVLVARRRDGRYVALAPQEPGKNVFVREVTVGVSARSRMEIKEWVMVGPRWRTWWVIRDSKAWHEWNHAASPATHLRGPELEEAVRGLMRHVGGEVLAVTHDGESRHLLAWLAPEVGAPPARILTGAMPRVEVPTVGAHWRRGAGGTVQVRYEKFPRVYTWDRALHFNDDDDRPPWLQYSVGEVVFRDEAAIARATARRARVGRAAERRRALGHQVGAYMAGIRAQWQARAEQAAYDRFIEDYLDPELWEGHRKTLRIDLPREALHQVEHLISQLVERGIEVEGLSVSAASERLRKAWSGAKALPDDTAAEFGAFLLAVPEATETDQH